MSLTLWNPFLNTPNPNRIPIVITTTIKHMHSVQILPGQHILINDRWMQQSFGFFRSEKLQRKNCGENCEFKCGEREEKDWNVFLLIRKAIYYYFINLKQYSLFKRKIKIFFSTFSECSSKNTFFFFFCVIYYHVCYYYL